MRRWRASGFIRGASTFANARRTIVEAVNVASRRVLLLVETSKDAAVRFRDPQSGEPLGVLIAAETDDAEEEGPVHSQA